MSVLAQARALAAEEPVLEQSIPVTATEPSAELPAGTYWSLQNLLPPLPYDMFPELPVYTIDPSNGVFLIDDRSVNFPALQAQQAEQAQVGIMAGSLMAMGAPMPGDGGDDGTNFYTPNGSSYSVDFGTNLWIAKFALSQGNAVGLVSNTTADISYEIQYKNDLTSTQWLSTGFFILGSELTNWTAMSLPGVSMTNNAFFRIRSWADDGSGLPIWWQMQYFGTNGVDPYGDPMGDGRSNLQKFQNGMNPNVFYTPPAPQGLTVSYNASNGTANISWLPSPGPVTGYTVQRNYYLNQIFPPIETFHFPTNATSFGEDVSALLPYDLSYSGPTISVNYQVQAHYAGGDSTWSAPVGLETDPSLQSPSAPPLLGFFIPGPQGSVYFATPTLPPDTVALRITRVDRNALDYNPFFGGNLPVETNFDILVPSPTNGLYLIPAAWDVMLTNGYRAADYEWWVQTVNANGGPSVGGQVWNNYGFPLEDLNRRWLEPPYFDGRAQLKQNLIFLLRDATLNAPFQHSEDSSYFNSQDTLNIVTFNNPATYEYAGFYQQGESAAYYPYNFFGSFDPYWPFENNYRYRNFVFSSSDVDIGGDPTNGVADGAGSPLMLHYPPTYVFQPPATNGATIPALLATNQTQSLVSNPYEPLFYTLINNIYYDMTSIGITYEVDWDTGIITYTLANNPRNYFGLPYQSVNLAFEALDGDGNPTGNLETYPLAPGASYSSWQSVYFYPVIAQPQFQLAEYDFWVNPDSSVLPGGNSFTMTQTNPVMITSVGNPNFQVVGYAKLAVLNGYPGVYGYLGQYFDQAYKAANPQKISLNPTGVLSPYGSFFATEPGPAALVTMPDVDTGQRGVCMVNCCSMNVDKNADGNMDLTFNGPDATSQASPMKFWINSGYSGVNGNAEVMGAVLPNYSYGNITCPRDLENFARLWICGLPALTNANYQVTLSWQNTSGNPAINLYASVETNGGTGYLTDTNVAAQQSAVTNIAGSGYGYSRVGPGVAIAEITNGATFTFPASYFTNSGNKYFLFEGAGIGEGQLTLTISQNGNTIAKTGVWLDSHDIKDFYERAVITDSTSGSISSWSSSIELSQPAIANLCGNDTNLIVFVHGINVKNWAWLDDSDTVLKRLYWAGYRGKFATVDWPCNFFDWSLLLTQTSVFNQSEVKAYKASSALATYLNQLRSRFTGYRLNLYVHSQGNAVVSEAIEQSGVQFDTYILTQGAMPDSAYDVNAPTNTTLLNAEFGYGTPQWRPMGYLGSYTNLPGRIVNFYNPLDPVLDWWVTDQEDGKPDGYLQNLIVPCAYYTFDGVNGWHHNILGITDYEVTDPEESRAMISRSMTLPIGQSGPASAHGVIQSAVDLHANFNFSDTSFDDHSAQWAWPIQITRPYFQQVLTSCGIQPAP